MRGWDYASSGHYYITIVTAGRNRLFGEIVNGEMILNDLGQIVYDEFFKSFELREELFLGEFVLMPDHLHAIVILDKSNCTVDIAGTCGDVETCGRVVDARPCVYNPNANPNATNHPQPRNSNANPNPFHHSWPVINHQPSNELMIGLIRTICQWQNSTKTILCGNRIIMTISFETKQNIDTFPIISSVIQ